VENPELTKYYVFISVVSLLNLNNAQKHILFTFLTHWLTLRLTVMFVNCLQ